MSDRVHVSVTKQKPELLLFAAGADHPHRDAACATLAWLAEAQGWLFECYYGSPHSGVHFGGGHPAWHQPADLRGGTITGGHHMEELLLLLERFSCQAACLGQTVLDQPLCQAGVPILSQSGDIATFYKEVWREQGLPATLLLLGDGGRPQGVALTAYAFPEVIGRRALAIADGDEDALTQLEPERRVEGVFLPADRHRALQSGGHRVEAGFCPQGSVAEQTRAMAERWEQERKGFLLGDPELVGRLIPTAARNGWAPLYGVPQSEVIGLMSDAIKEQDVVYGRQYNDQDFFQLSKRGVAFQLFDPGRPPFPVIKEAPGTWPAAPADRQEPSDDELRGWAKEGKVVSSLLFWTGMIRELENLYALADVLGITGISAGLILSTESFRYMRHAPLSLVQVPREAGGLFPDVELLLVDVGIGVVIAGEAPAERVAATLKASVKELEADLGDPGLVPRGWWGTMDAPLVPRRRPRVSRFPDWPYLRIRHRPRAVEMRDPSAQPAPNIRHSVRSLVRESPLGPFFAPLRPYDAHAPGRPSRQVLEGVRDAGFEYGFTKSHYGPRPCLVDGIKGITVINHTAGQWDGWTPFVTINDISDLRRAERRLLGRKRPGWLVGQFDACLWTFTGPIWGRASQLGEICRWLARGGDSGRLVNVTPRVMARYAAILGSLGLVDRIEVS